MRAVGLVALLAYELDEGDAVDAVRIPADTQGALWAEIGGVGPGLWLGRSMTPHLARFDASDMKRWAEPACDP